MAIAAAQAPLALIVVGDATTRTSIDLALADERYRTALAVNGSAGLEEFQRLRPDIVLLDAALTGLSGIDCCTQLRQLPGGDRVPILLIVEPFDCAEIERAFAAGATDYLTKPIHRLVLVQRARRLIAARVAEYRATRQALLLARQKTWERLLRDGFSQLGRQPRLTELFARVRDFWNVDGLALYDRRTHAPLAAAPLPAITIPPGEPIARLLAAASIDGTPVAYSDLARSGLAEEVVAPLQERGIQNIAAATAAERYVLCAYSSTPDPHDFWQPDAIEHLSDLSYLAFLALSTFEPMS